MRILHIGGVTFSSKFCFAETVSRFGQRLKIQELSLDIETGIETFGKIYNIDIHIPFWFGREGVLMILNKRINDSINYTKSNKVFVENPRLHRVC